ncbi:MAG: glycosyltransferase family 1 protein, partial [Bacteroidetes bacterium]
MGEEGSFELEVWYCSAHGLKGEVDREFGTSVKWDIPVLEGY